MGVVPSNRSSATSVEAWQLLDRLSEALCPFIRLSTKAGRLWSTDIEYHSDGDSQRQLIGCLLQCCEWFCDARLRLRGPYQDLFSAVIYIHGDAGSGDCLAKSGIQLVCRSALARSWVLSAALSPSVSSPYRGDSPDLKHTSLFVLRSFDPARDAKFARAGSRREQNDFDSGSLSWIEKSLLSNLRCLVEMDDGPARILEWASAYAADRETVEHLDSRAIQPPDYRLNFSLVRTA